MLNVKCDLCGKELNEPGALLFSPPTDSQCIKYHVCIRCYDIIFSEAVAGRFTRNWPNDKTND